MRKSRKTGKVIVLLLVCAFLLFSVAGCAPKMCEDGYFTYYIRKGNDGIKYAHISELTELGKQQKVLVIPEEIDGKKVLSIDKWKFDMWSPGLVWESDNLEKVFFSTSTLIIDSSTFDKCVVLKKIVVIYFDLTSGSGGGDTINISTHTGHLLHIPKKTFDVCTFINRDSFLKPANITYFYNFETDINYGVYWIDDINYGGVIKYIPKDPTRDEYDFGGWYREESCINKWDFDIDTLPQEQIDEKGNSIYQETKLYAKWIKK